MNTIYCRIVYIHNVALTPAFYIRTLCRIRPSDVKGKFWRRSSRQGVTKRCRLSWLTKSALEYEPKCGVSAMQWVYIHLHRSPNKLWRSNSIFNLWVQRSFAVVSPVSWVSLFPSLSRSLSALCKAGTCLSTLASDNQTTTKKPGILPCHFLLGSEIGHYAGSGTTIRIVLYVSRNRIHESTISLRFLGIILRVIRFEVYVYNVYITYQFQTIFA